MNNYKKYFSKFLTMNEGKHHFACHSHHYWPDCTREAQVQYWDDSSKMVDDKWGYIFSKKVPHVQKLISNILNYDRPSDITFAPNTHELVYRVLSSYEKKIKILTTDSEFYSFSRQMKRMLELDLIDVTVIKTEPFNSFEKRFIEASKDHFDVVFFSHVFFNSGIAINNLSNFTQSLIKENTQVIVDAYHGFMALPTDLSKISDDIFYIAGSYKYAAGGEGCCFMTIPKSCKLTPRNTGWFAELGNLENVDPNIVPFSNDGLRFAGSTFDFTALYRLESVLSLYEKESISVSDIHSHVKSCQNSFLKAMDSNNHELLNRDHLLSSDKQGHFLTFELGSSEKVKLVRDKLITKNILTDSRESRLRFGFSIYHDNEFDYSIIFKD